MAKDDLTGNMATENVISYFKDHHSALSLDMQTFQKSMEIAVEIFPT